MNGKTESKVERKLEIAEAHANLREHNAHLASVIHGFEQVLEPLLREPEQEKLSEGYLACPSTSPLMRTFFEELNTLHSLTLRLENLMDRVVQ